MSEIKWVKLTVDMFDNRKIRYIRKLPEGNNIVLIWVMLLTLAGRCNSGGMIFLTERIPYTTKMLADELCFEESIIVMAITVLENLEMVTTSENGVLSVNGWGEHQNIEGMEAAREKARIRSARYRANQKALQQEENEGGQLSLPGMPSDRSAAYAARHIAKNIVAAGIADKCQVQLAYVIGYPYPVSVRVDTYGTGKEEEAVICEAVRSTWDLTPAGIIKAFDLRKPVYKNTAAYGHFGEVCESGRMWERVDKVDELLAAIAHLKGQRSGIK